MLGKNCASNESGKAPVCRISGGQMTPLRLAWSLSLGLVFAIGDPGATHAELLKNTEFGNGKAHWKGGGQVVFVKPDGTEGTASDPGTVRALRISLKKKEPQSVYQEFATKDRPKTLKVTVQYMASPDFKRTEDEKLYSISWTSGTYFWTAVVVPHADFWVRVSPGWLYRIGGQASTKWQTLQGTWNDALPVEERAIHFCVPAGEGNLYIKDPVVTQ